MKRLVCIVLMIGLLGGCAGGDNLDGVLALRSRLLAESCAFDAKIIADYGDMVYQFTLSCDCARDGTVKFRVIAPESIAGISGSVASDGGKLEFQDTALAFAMMADGQISPVGAPYVLMKALLGGYITACGREGDTLRVTIQDNYDQDAMTVDVWLNEDHLPLRAEILWDNRRILTMELENFVIG